MEAVAARAETPTSLDPRLSAQLGGPALLFLWQRSGAVGVPDGAGVDVLGALRNGIRKVAAVATRSQQQDGFASRSYVVKFGSADEVLMAWSLLSSGAKGGAEVDAAFLARSSLRPLHGRVTETQGGAGSGA